MTSATDPGATPTPLIAAEVRALRKGRGLQAADLDQRLGVHLRELVGATATSDRSDLRDTLASQLSGYAAKLPSDLCTAIMASLGLSAATRQMAHFGDRAWWLADHTGCNYRTALRHIDAAEQLLAEEIARELRHRRGRPAAPPHDWYLQEFRMVLRLDTGTPESHEFRRIVATRAGLTEVIAWLDVPRNPGEPRMELAAEVVYGGTLVRREMPSSSKFQFFIQLPAPLQLGETHDYALILRAAPGAQLKPHSIFTPECRCDTFDLRVRFDPANPPVWIRRVDGETVRMFEDARPGSEPMIPDPAGEVHVQFGNPKMYLGYGLQWQPR